MDIIGNYVLLRFHSDADFQKEGFRLSFSTFPLPGKYKELTFCCISLETYIHVCAVEMNGFSFQFLVQCTPFYAFHLQQFRSSYVQVRLFEVCLFERPSCLFSLFDHKGRVASFLKSNEIF